MKSNNHVGENLRSAIVQLQRVARQKRVQSLHGREDRVALMQESRQIDEAVRLLRWISK